MSFTWDGCIERSPIDWHGAFLDCLASPSADPDQLVRLLLESPIPGIVPLPLLEIEEFPSESVRRLQGALVAVIGIVESEEARLRSVIRYGPVRLDDLALRWIEALEAHRGRERALHRAAIARLEGGGDLVERLRERSLARRWIAYTLARPSLRDAIGASLGTEPDHREIADLLAGPWPPVGLLPVALAPEAIEALEVVAVARPGTRSGPDPDNAAKIARVVLATVGHWDAPELQEQALRAYDNPRERQGHDVVACALAHPGLDQKQALADLLWENAVTCQGWRSHRKLNRILRWAAGRGWIRMPWESR